MRKMIKKKINLLSLVIFTIFFISLISAVPPVTTVQSFPSGYNLIESTHQYQKVNSDWDYNFFVQNSSTGKEVNNDTTICTFFLAYDNGTVFFSQEAGYSDGYWNIRIKAGNFTTTGYYPYGLNCQDGAGGSLSGTLVVTNTGEFIETPQAIIYVGLLGILILVFISIFLGMSFLPNDNAKDEEGKILQISYLKHLRLVLWLAAYFLFIAIIFLSSNIASAYLPGELFNNLLFALFSILLAVSPVVVIVILISFFVRFYHDKQFQQLLNRGMFPGGQV